MSVAAVSADGLLALADEAERRYDFAAAAACLESALRQPHAAALLPLTEARARLRLASLLLAPRGSSRTPRAGAPAAAKVHLERALLILSPLPSAPPRLKLLAHSHLAGAYAVLGTIASQKHVLRRALGLLDSASASGLLQREPALLWTCNFQAQLASALTIDGDAASALSTLSVGASAAAELGSPQLELFFAASELHVHLLCWEDSAAVENAVARASLLWEALTAEQMEHWVGLFFYTQLLQTFYLLRICDYKAASQRVERLDTAVKSEMQRGHQIKELANDLSTVERTLGQSGLKEREMSALLHKQRQLKAQLRVLCGYDSLNDVLEYGDKLLLAPPLMHGEWLPRTAVFVLVDLMVVMVGRPKGIFKECGKRINSGLRLIHDELVKLGIVDGVMEANLEHSTIWIAGLYLILLLQFLENKVAVELTRSEFVEAQEIIVSRFVMGTDRVGGDGRVEYAQMREGRVHQMLATR